MPDQVFQLTEAERVLTTQEVGDGRAKNVSYDPTSGRLGGADADAATSAHLAALLDRFGIWARGLIADRFVRYGPRLMLGRASYRSRCVEDAPASLRKDDRRLHIDAFTSQPVAGRRILRVFSNIDVAGAPRIWAIGEPFEDYARRFAGRARSLLPGEAAALQALKITRSRRTPYDQLMLQLHDLAKLDDAYQASAPRRRLSFGPGATWVVFSDQLPHAALKGRFALEQTFYLPVDALADPETSPLRILERLRGRKLV